MCTYVYVCVCMCVYIYCTCAKSCWTFLAWCNSASKCAFSATNSCTCQQKIKGEVDALGVITISRGCFERCCNNQKTPPYHS